jgi:hypothetical protein
MADNRSGARYILGGMPHRFVLRPGCTIVWGKPNSPQRALCAICHGALPDVPLMLWRSDGSAASFCEECTDKWIELKQCST